MILLKNLFGSSHAEIHPKLLLYNHVSFIFC